MLAPLAPPTPDRLFRTQLAADAAARERTVAWVVLASVAVLIPVEWALRGVQGVAMSRVLVEALAGLGAYYALVLVLLRAGPPVALIATVNVIIESTFTALVLWLAARVRGPFIALTSSLNVAWPALVALSALRGRWRLSLAAGFLAAAGYALVFWHIGAGPGAPDTITASGVLMRTLFLVAAGVIAAATAAHLTHKAEAAFKAMRALDLMSRYVLRQRLGEGGMGEVFLATYCPEGGFEKDVAVKRILPAYSDDDAFAEMFLAEAKLGSLLNHPNVVQILDVGRYQGQLLMAMEYVDGVALDRLVDGLGGPMPLAAAISVAEQMAAALAYIHFVAGPQGKPLHLIHRDVNPPNVLVSRFGQVKLTDFGVAARARPADEADANAVGKLAYMAPEAAEGRPEAASDLYALGLTLRELLTGEVSPVSATAELPAVWAARARPLAGADLPPPLAELVQALLAEDPDDRPDARQVRERLREISLTDPSLDLAEGREALTRLVEQVREAPADPVSAKTTELLTVLERR